MKIIIPPRKKKAKRMTILVNDGETIIKTFRFKIGDPESFQKAMKKAKSFINQ